MRRFQHMVVAACLMVLLVMNTSVAGPWCGSDATLIYRLWNYTQADSDWWPSADLVDFVSIVDTGDLSFLQWARLACVPFGFAYFGEGCRVHDECYDSLAYPGASRQQCDQVAKDMWIDACNRQYPDPKWWEVWRWPVPLCRAYCEATAEVMMAGLAVFADKAWEAAAPNRAANAATVHSRQAFNIRKQCLEMIPPGGTCVIPAGDYREVLTIDRPVRLERAGGWVRIGSD